MWILPSLGRPDRAQEVAEAAPEAPILLRLHWGDEKLDDYQKIKWPTAWKVVIHPKQNLADSLNWAFREYPHAETYGFLADDTIPSPKDWWRQLEYAAGHWNIAYPNDGIHGISLCTHHCIGGRLMREVGWWALPGLKHSFLDTVWYTVGYHLGLLRYIQSVQFNHHHPIVKKAEHDPTYEIGQSFYSDDKDVFEHWADSGSGTKLLDRTAQAMGLVSKSAAN